MLLFTDLAIKTRRKPKQRKTGRTQYRRKAHEDYHRPQVYSFSLLIDSSVAPDRDGRVDAMAERWKSRVPLELPGDSVDYVSAFERLGMSMWEESLALRGLRECLSGIHKTDNGRYRIRPGWDADRQRHGSVINGYADTLGEAKAKLIAWWKVERNIDIAYSPPPWLVELLSDAARLQAQQSEDAEGLAWGVLPDEEDDD